ncbi:sulfide dehydrogenase (flavocytochrome c) cytochrome c subunit [Pseudomonas sp. SJZ079]|uniref:c-type cytochrome n=1 Tax=Pseudomonas sp. SJZ079 TaxID=2572887 RepID=UPI0011990AD0|nr:cytochrome c class I [Pseudomonas sp. SJZ079]TWC34630.1 sulfide dehydrogenase (flavocytochrome c) cytochrome c subunit [Pseudomonas sp. SJZ079]
MKHLATPFIAFSLFAASSAPAWSAEPTEPSAEPPAGRLLATQCFQCHGTNGKSQSEIDSIDDESADELFEELLEMKASPKVTVMNQQAKAYSDAELRLIADYLGRTAGNDDDGHDDRDDD